MFYSQDILQKRGGKFGIIWIAATRGVQLSRREYTSVHIRRTCEDIINYITLQQHPHQTGVRPRFSLYLSSQLMVGVSRVFRKQTGYLFDDVTTLWHKCMSFSSVASVEIDLHMRRNVDATFPSPLALHGKELYSMGFGSFREYSDLGIDNQPDLDVWMCSGRRYDTSFGSGSPEAQMLNQPDIPLPATPDRFQTVRDSPLQARREEITMRENDVDLTHHFDPQNAGVQDLPPVDPLDLDQITEDKDLSTSIGSNDQQQQANGAQDAMTDPLQPQPDVVLPEEPMPEAPIQTTDAPMDVQESWMAPAEETPANIIDPEQLNLPERPLHKQAPQSPDVTPIPKPTDTRAEKRKRLRMPMQLLPMEEGAETAAKRRRRRHLIIDQSIQIPHRTFRSQMDTGAVTCLTHIELADPHCQSVQNLFKVPFSKVMRDNPTFRALWDRNLRTRSLPSTEEDRETTWTVPSESSGSDNDSPKLVLQPHNISADDVEGQQDMDLEAAIGRIHDASISHIEMARDASISHIEVARDASSTQLETTGIHDITPAIRTSRLAESEDSFDDPTHKSSRRNSDSLHDTKDTTLESFAEELPQDLPLQPIPETSETPGTTASPPGEQVQEPAPEQGPGEEQGPPTSPGLRVEEDRPLEKQREDVSNIPAHHRLMKSIKKHTKNDRATMFHEVCPFTVQRMHAALLFSALLDICALKRVVVHQEEPYAEIIIKRGLKWK